MLATKVKDSRFSNAEGFDDGKIVDPNAPSGIMQTAVAPKETTTSSAPVQMAPAETIIRDERPTTTPSTTNISYNIETRPLLIEKPIPVMADAIVVPTPKGVQSGSFGGGGGGGGSSASEEVIPEKKKMSAWWWLVIAAGVYTTYKLVKK